MVLHFRITIILFIFKVYMMIRLDISGKPRPLRNYCKNHINLCIHYDAIKQTYRSKYHLIEILKSMKSRNKVNFQRIKITI